jgi:hypothetical protein
LKFNVGFDVPDILQVSSTGFVQRHLKIFSEVQTGLHKPRFVVVAGDEIRRDAGQRG